jgi:hypothetical protein
VATGKVGRGYSVGIYLRWTNSYRRYDLSPCLTMSLRVTLAILGAAAAP